MGQRPDNRASWNAISAAYQRDLGWPEERLTWGIRCGAEDDLRLLGDVRGKRVLVLGCGGGQDIVALAAMGAAEITGIDISEAQLAHARRLLAERGVPATLIEDSAEDLSSIGDANMEIAVSIHALNYVERADLCFAGTFRVLVPGGLFALSVLHPANASTHDEPPYGWEKPYFQVEFDWRWKGLPGEPPFRSYYRTVADWFGLLRDAGFTVERLLEPPPVDDASGWARKNDYAKCDTVPGTLIFTARKPGENP